METNQASAMATTAKSQHTDDHPPSGSSNSAGKSTPPVGNNPPEQQPHPSNANRKKRPAYHLSIPYIASKRLMNESSTGNSIGGDQTDTNTGSPRREEEINLLKDVLDFYQETGKCPDVDLDNLTKFYVHWVQGRVEDYEDEFEVSEKIDELNFRFFKNLVKKLDGEDVEGAMDPMDIKIFRLSNLIWG